MQIKNIFGNTFLQRYVIKIEQFLRICVLDSFNTVYRDKDSILEKIFEKQIFLAYY